MSAVSKWRAVIKEHADGRVELLPTLPAGTVMRGPVKTLEVEAPGLVTMPSQSMTPQEFNAFMDNMPVGSKVNIGLLR